MTPTQTRRASTWFPVETVRWWRGSWRCGGSGGGGWRCWFRGTWLARPPGRGHSAWLPSPPCTARASLQGHLKEERVLKSTPPSTSSAEEGASDVEASIKALQRKTNLWEITAWGQASKAFEVILKPNRHKRERERHVVLMKNERRREELWKSGPEPRPSLPFQWVVLDSPNVRWSRKLQGAVKICSA